MLRLLRARHNLHYFPTIEDAPRLNADYAYHRKLLEAVKHRHTTFQMPVGGSTQKKQKALVQTVSLPMKSQSPACTTVGQS